MDNPGEALDSVSDPAALGDALASATVTPSDLQAATDLVSGKTVRCGKDIVLPDGTETTCDLDRNHGGVHAAVS
jgi:hypothetical protein